ncbi:hypothetical protein Back2_00630 [Nocardioides baekrokdamisoli]|uniref:Uncharacterized protein n=1 Tax=Nocardioides baekrokdamisoli TaxID=1804624 RepID=A0A3G9IBW2_9ACTN|nr:hypothetical protein [Nocardioides baekrokdamisoli]BBH15776.1 hypothetical protein Back2_00630 [Nocardioides baekrokdamisoli]
MRDHTYLNKRTVRFADLGGLDFDIFVSSDDQSDRVRKVAEAVNVPEGYWILHPEYDLDAAGRSTAFAEIAVDSGVAEVDAWRTIWQQVLNGRPPQGLRVCIDISGMMRPFIAVLPVILAKLGFGTVSVLYTDPTNYVSGPTTTFSKGRVDEVRQVPGLEGVHTTSTDPADVLIIGAGYDDSLIRAVADYKRSASSHYIMLGLPSLQPHMYQESQIRLALAEESITDFASKSFLHAPANDPFVTASVLSAHVAELRQTRPDLNVYLSPVGPKAHVLGFGWYFACEELQKPTSILFPYAPSYSTGSAAGLSRSHLYELDLTWIDLPAITR